MILEGNAFIERVLPVIRRKRDERWPPIAARFSRQTLDGDMAAPKRAAIEGSRPTSHAARPRAALAVAD
jgi:hypothetical protein